MIVRKYEYLDGDGVVYDQLSICDPCLEDVGFQEEIADGLEDGTIRDAGSTSDLCCDCRK